MSNRSSWSGVLCALAALGGLGSCALIGGAREGTLSGDTYVNLDRGFAFRVPSGWNEVRSRTFLGKDDYVVRFRSPGEDAQLTARAADVGAAACDAAAQILIQKSSDVSISSPEAFQVETPAGPLPAWRGKLQAATERRGETAFFCAGDRIVVLEALSLGGDYESQEAELGAAVRSFAYAGSPTLVHVAPPPTPIPVAYFTHVIEWRGQTLSQIARWYTGDRENWKRLTDLNGLTVGNAALRVGRVIRIPPDLVTNRKPMPKPRPVRVSPPPPAEPVEEPASDLPAVIGPK